MLYPGSMKLHSSHFLLLFWLQLLWKSSKIQLVLTEFSRVFCPLRSRNPMKNDLESSICDHFEHGRDACQNRFNLLFWKYSIDTIFLLHNGFCRESILIFFSQNRPYQMHSIWTANCSEDISIRMLEVDKLIWLDQLLRMFFFQHRIFTTIFFPWFVWNKSLMFFSWRCMSLYQNLHHQSAFEESFLGVQWSAIGSNQRICSDES